MSIMFKNEQTIFPLEDTLMPSLNDAELQMLQSILPLSHDDMHNPQYNEDTMDVMLKHQQFELMPVSPLGPPVRLNFPGNANFTVEIDATHTRKKKYLYSHRLNRIYVDVGCNFSVGFRWNVNEVHNQDMYVRATVVFADEAQAEKRVERCYQHSHENSNAVGAERALVMNVLRSARDMGSSDLYYCGIPERSDSWYSVVVRLREPAALAYVFACKSSCSSGINRRPIDVIFTLEDVGGKVYGRQSVGARVCSCPRRDMLRDEEDAVAPRGKRLAPAAPAGPAAGTHKRAKGDRDAAVVIIPQIEVTGIRTAVTGLEVMINMMEQLKDAYINAKQPEGISDGISAQIAKLKTHIENLKSQKK